MRLGSSAAKDRVSKFLQTIVIEPVTSDQSNGLYRWRQQPEREVNTMAASIAIEQESGMSIGRAHPHNGYYAGDFTSEQRVLPAAWSAPIPAAFDQQPSRAA
jgi:hypothetical protein